MIVLFIILLYLFILALYHFFNKAAEEIDKYCENGGENNDKSNKK